MNEVISRRDAISLGAAAVSAGFVAKSPAVDDIASSISHLTLSTPFLTPAEKFTDVSRGDPIPHTLARESLVKARLTAETWRLEIVSADKIDDQRKATVQSPKTIAGGDAIDLPSLLKLGEKYGVRFLKAMQCQNIAFPLGQGLWEGVPLRDVLRTCGKIDGARRLFFWGYHNDKPEQIFQSSLAMSQVMDAPPGELPPFIAYKLNGGPIPLKRGGPVRMVVPWAHGFKSIKWLQKILFTNDFRANDTYADDGNDPESYLKTAAYFDDVKAQSVSAGGSVTIRGTAMVGWPGLERVEYWLRPDVGAKGKLADDDPAWSSARWQPCNIDPPPTDWGKEIPSGATLKDIWGFDQTGKPKEWPLRFSIARWTIDLKNLSAGAFELRVRTVDKNGFAQPAPRPGGVTGRNLVQCKLLRIEPNR
jgi:DMSO/TMAO reductase YedYZ molybdopterin-dependent catalytic subunit